MPLVNGVDENHSPGPRSLRRGIESAKEFLGGKR